MAEKERDKYPNLHAMREFDRKEHIRRGMEAGLSREEAEKHAEQDMAEREER